MHGRHLTLFFIVALCLPVAAQEAGSQSVEPWPWIDPPGAESITLLLMGDTNIQNRADPGNAYQYVLPTLQAADLRFTNLEGPLAGTSKDPRLPDIPHKSRWTHSEPEMVQGLVAAGIDVVGVANNVTYPWQALLRSLEVLDANGIKHTGGGLDLEEAHQPVIVEREGVRFGFIQYTATYWPFQHAAGPETPGAATVQVDTYYKPPPQVLDKPGQPPLILTIPDPASLQRMVDDIRRLRRSADVVVASYHWGVSNTTEMVEFQRTIGRAAIDAGADIVMGHGPHVFQPVEVWKGRPIFYSLANFVFDWEIMRKAPDGLLVRVAVQDGRLARVAAVPLRRNADKDPVLLDPNEGVGQELYQQLVALSGGGAAPLRLEGREIVVTGIRGVAGEPSGSGERP